MQRPQQLLPRWQFAACVAIAAFAMTPALWRAVGFRDWLVAWIVSVGLRLAVSGFLLFAIVRCFRKYGLRGDRISRS
jgi:hypothetical protein